VLWDRGQRVSFFPRSASGWFVGAGRVEEAETIEQRKTMSLYINNTWVHQQGRHWIARAVAFSEKGNDVTISSCHDSPELAYERLLAGMKELQLVPADWDE
jgi:hypothetical protein